MIRNLTQAEWEAVIAAFALADVHWEEEGQYESLPNRQRAAINRAQSKIRQLAPEEST
jgi:hypothetical protein